MQQQQQQQQQHHSHPRPHPHSHSPAPSHSTSHLLHSALDELLSLLQQPSPPSLRELLQAYSQKGNGDRELLLAMLAAKSSEDQRVAAVIQSHQTLIQAHAVAQQQQHQALSMPHQAISTVPNPAAPTLPSFQQPQTQYHPQLQQHQHQHQHLLSPSTPVITPPSPSGTSQSQSSSSSPHGKQTKLPSLHTHLADLRTLPAGPQTKRRRTERDAMMLDSITSGKARINERSRNNRNQRGGSMEEERESGESMEERETGGTRYRDRRETGTGMPRRGKDAGEGIVRMTGVSVSLSESRP